MSKDRSRKIPLEGSEPLGANPFAGLDSAGLPAGESMKEITKNPKPLSSKQKSKGRVEVRREKAGRGGKTVTTLREFPSHIPLRTLETMTLDLKKTCACGGTLKGRVVELQGDVRDRVCRELNARGYQAVRAGG